MCLCRVQRVHTYIPSHRRIDGGQPALLNISISPSLLLQINVQMGRDLANFETYSLSSGTVNRYGHVLSYVEVDQCQLRMEIYPPLVGGFLRRTRFEHLFD